VSDTRPRATDGLRIPALLPSAVADLLREQIISGALAAGERLVETSLAEPFDVSRGPIREGLKLLVEEGLVVNLPRRGTYVTQLTAKDVREIYDYRAAIESRAVRLAVAAVPTPEAVAELEEIVREIEEAADRGDAQAARELDLDFHGLLYQLAGNDRLLAAFRRLVPSLRLLNRSRYELFHSLREAPQEHWPIIEAIRRGDRALAESEIDQHLEHAKEQLIAHIAGPEVEGAR
jgi:GntR family transcriptional regulator of gluconate operon